LLIYDEFVANPVEFVSRDPRFDIIPNHIEDISREAPGDAHFVLLRGSFYRNGHMVPSWSGPPRIGSNASVTLSDWIWVPATAGKDVEESRCWARLAMV
jgi:hypothetical protein